MIVRAKKVCKSLQGPNKKTISILEDICLEIEAGEFLTVLGPSGSGKTTLLQILGLMDSVTSGELEILEKDTKELSVTQKAKLRSDSIGFIFQTSLLISDLTLLENIKLAGKVSEKVVEAEYIDYLIEKVGLADKKDHYPKMLSTGEAQRGCLARAFVNSPELILADEPTANLDKENKIVVLDLMKEFRKEKDVSIVLASHDELVLDYSDRFLYLRDGKISEK